MNRRIKFSVVIVTYNRLNLLKECLYAVENQTVQFNHIIIVDNASTDGTTEYLKQYKNSNASVILESENAGGAAGYWRGVSEFNKNDDEYVLLIDDDAILYNDFLENIINGIDKDQEKYVAYAGVVVSNNLIDLSHRKKILDSRHFRSNAIELEAYDNDTFKCDLASFCGIVIKADIIQKIGLPEKDFFIWYDDTEYSLRIRQFSPILVITNARLNHKTKNTTVKEKAELDWKNYYGIRNEMIIVKKYYGKSEFIYFWARNTKRIIIDIVKSLIRKEHKAYWKNAVLRKDAVMAVMTGEKGKNQKYCI